VNLIVAKVIGDMASLTSAMVQEPANKNALLERIGEVMASLEIYTDTTFTNEDRELMYSHAKTMREKYLEWSERPTKAGQ
jgi:hypothetical protein